ncbi:MAG: Ig-like domain-containing protein [Planctomycetota bacterium]
MDGDGDGVPGGAYNFWFQTRALNRRLTFTDSSNGIAQNETITITDVLGESRTYEFVPDIIDTDPSNDPTPGNVPIRYPVTGLSLTANALAQALADAFTIEQQRNTDSGQVAVLQNGSTLEFLGVRSVELSRNFRGAETLGRTIFVDKTAGVDADGSLLQPFKNIANANEPNAFDAALPGDIVRIVGNAGNDNDPTTESDNESYQIGIANTGGVALDDGNQMEIPNGVTTMIDAGAIFKLRNSRIGVGSDNLTEDRSGGALQVLGTPRRVRLSATGSPVVTTLLTDNEQTDGYRDGAVIFTSINDDAVGTTVGSNGSAIPGDWGGLVFRRDIDQLEGRTDVEDEGIFLQNVTHADIRYGGGSRVLIDSTQQLVNPIQIFNLRPTVTQSEIRFSADAAISASPDSFEETTFQAPRFQRGGDFTADYTRVGPSIYDNLIVDNSVNGLFVRVETTPNTAPRPLTLSGRFDDTDIVHYIAENLVVQGTPGGPIIDGLSPDFSSTAFNLIEAGNLAAGTYDYRLTFVDANGFESLASDATASVTVPANSSIELVNLPPVPANTDYIGRRLYRLSPASGNYEFLAQLNATDSSFLDDGTTSDGILDLSRTGIRGRLDASLVIDPSTVLKFRGSRIELGQGTNLLAEGFNTDRVIFTSFADDRFGAGGTFDTNNDVDAPAGSTDPARGDWSGIYAGPTAYVSLDHAVIAYGGGISLLEGGAARGFAALELQQAEGRVTNSRFEFNEDGQDGQGPVGRLGRLGITPSTIFVRGSQPTIVENDFIDNRGSIIDIDSDSMTAERRVDLGRQTEFVDAFTRLNDNYGPLIRLNRYENVPTSSAADRQLSGLEVRGGQLTTETIFDDTDIDHLLFDTLEVGNLNVSGGLRLISRSDQSLVVKLNGSGSQFDENFGTGITAAGSLGNDPDRVGGSVQIIGLPGAPVVLTSLWDDSIGSGLTPAGTQFTDTGGDGITFRPEPNDWRSVLLDQFSNDANFDYILEETITSEVSPGLNGTTTNAQVLGTLAPNVLAGDEVRRLGFEVEGFLSADDDVDVYSFTGVAGTRVFFDVDSTSFNLDTVVEFLDGDGNVLARSNDSFSEVAGTTALEAVDQDLEDTAGTLASGPSVYVEFDAGGNYLDDFSSNPRDAGLAITLPGNRGSEGPYFFRVRSRSINTGDTDGGLTDGGYRVQVRLSEEQQTPGSIVRFTDIRYANHGIHIIGKPGESPLLGDAQENEATAGFTASNDSFTMNPNAPGQRPQYLGNIQNSKRGNFSVGGALGSAADVDFYRIDVAAGQTLESMIFDIDYADGFSRPDTALSLYYDVDETDDIPPVLVAVGNNSNILDDVAVANANDPIELLTRGSITTNDPLIGPLTLTQGVYYVAVSSEGNAPGELSDPLARVEPIDSIVRIFDDQIESTGGTTFSAPIVPTFASFGTAPIDPTDMTISTPNFVVTNERSGNPGHQTFGTFNGSRTEGVVAGGVTGSAPAGQTSFANPAVLNPGGTSFSLAPNVEIGDRFRNTSQYIPHITVNGVADFGGEIVDVYQFEVLPSAGPFNPQVILDIDGGINPFQTPADQPPPEDQPSVVDPDSIDLKLQLFDATGELLQTSNFSPASAGEQGSVANIGSIFTDDPYIDTRLAPGVYFVAVSPEDTEFDAEDDVFTLGEDARPRSGTYRLHLSIEGDVSDYGGTNSVNNQSIRFDRSSDVDGVLRSNLFDLSGYTAGDVPRLYFDYFYDPSDGDSVEVAAVFVDNQGVQNEVILTDGITPNAIATVWSQEVIDLAEIAGMSDVRLEVRYTVGGISDGSEGLFLDNFVVGFAERGELVTGVLGGSRGFAGAGGAATGEYQLEIRPGTPYATPGGFGAGNPATTSFDTNDRHTRSAIIVAPAANQILDGDSFTLSDQVRTLTFEFDRLGNGGTTGNIIIPVADTDERADVADAIRNALNSQLVQSTLAITASDLGGSIDGASRGVDIAISGVVVGDFIELQSREALGDDRAAVTPGGDFQLPVFFTDGVGDVNVTRSQSQIIVDSNKISDVRGIGIYSEAGKRFNDPQDARGDDPDLFFQFEDDDPIIFGFGTFEFDNDDDQDFLQLPPMGSSPAGAVRNLPTLNNSVVGGLAPGPVIVNNTIDQAGYAGVKLAGATNPWVIDSFLTPTFTDLGDTFGSSISDGLVMTIDAGGTRVHFEFEEIRASPRPAGGSGEVGGNGFVDGHVPIYYSHTQTLYNPNGPDPNRDYAHTRHEVMMSIYQSIQGSILVSNGLVELVTPYIGPSPFIGNEFAENTYISEISFPSPAVFLEGVSGIYFSTAYQAVPGNPFIASQAPLAETPQPLSRVINNTIYGADGTAALFPGDPSESNDTLAEAIETRVGGSHVGPYTVTAFLGDELTPSPAASDVDIYQVDLTVGDRLVVDLDTFPTQIPDTEDVLTTDTLLRLFDADGNEITAVDNVVLANHLDTNDPVDPNDLTLGFDDTKTLDIIDEAGNVVRTDTFNIDPSIDFTALESGTYFVAVSSTGNSGYDPLTVDGRTAGIGGTGEYELSMEVLAPRSFVLSIDDDNLGLGGNILGTQGDLTANDLLGETITITQVYDRIETEGNEDNALTFELVAGNNQPPRLANGNVPIAITHTNAADYHVPDLIRAITNAINGTGRANSATLTNPPLPNGEFGNGPGGFSGPVQRVTAAALGGEDAITRFSGGATGLTVYNRNAPIFIGGDLVTNAQGEHYAPRHHFTPTTSDFQNGFGHDRTGQASSAGIGGTTTFGDGTTELYVFVERAAKIELSPGAIAAGLTLDPQPGRDTDQLIPETGLLLTGGSSATVANNVFSNLHQSLVVEETRPAGFSSGGPDLHPKPAEVIVTANVFQHDQAANTLFREGINIGTQNAGITPGPSNVNGGSDDFNVTLGGNDPLFVNPAANNFLPDAASVLVDASANSLTERDAIRSLRASIGLPVSNILAPARDVNGVLRVDNPDVAPPSGLGSNIFKDRGSTELADEVGPVATLFSPRDNDPDNVDVDPATGLLRLDGGVYEEFRIQLRDTGDASDPFRGLGVDDSTVSVSPIEDVRKPGANFTLFENEVLLVEGVDYSFEYDETQNVVTLRPLAGIFRNDFAYRIQINNTDSTVLTAPAAADLGDGQRLTVTDEGGADVVFEFESGISVSLPDPITLIVPEVGLGVGGLQDGEVFSLADGAGNVVNFEFDDGSGTLVGSEPILLPAGPAPDGGQALVDFREELATRIFDAIDAQTQGADPELDLVVRQDGDRVIIGGDFGTFASTEATGLGQDVGTLALRVPPVGIANRDGDVFVISDGINTETFELDIDGVLSNPNNIGIDVTGQLAFESAAAILDAIRGTDLNIAAGFHQKDGFGDDEDEQELETIFLDLPASGSIEVLGGPLEVRGVARSVSDGAQLVFSPIDGSDPVVFEFNQTDEVGNDGLPLGPNGDGVTEGNVAVNFDRSDDATTLAEKVIAAIRSGPSIAGVNDNDLGVFDQGLLRIGGQARLEVSSNTGSVNVFGRPGVTAPSSVSISGPIELLVPALGGEGIEDGDLLIVVDDDGNDVIFEFTLDSRPISITATERILPINYTRLSDSTAIADLVVTAINDADLGITAIRETDRVVSLGVIEQSRVILTGALSNSTTFEPPPSNPDGSRAAEGFSLQRGLVSDGEVFSITQGDITVRYEFNLAPTGGTVAPGNVPITFLRTNTIEEVNEQVASVVAGNLRGLVLNPRVNDESTEVVLNDQPGTIIDISQAPSLSLGGVPGGAVAVPISPEFTPVQVKESLIAAINSLSPTLTTVRASDRGGDTFFVSGGEFFDGPLDRFNLPAVADLAGNPLEANVDNERTQFTLLLPTIGLDYGDAPDPADGIAGRYPTRLQNDGARHIVDPIGQAGSLVLGTSIDVDDDGQPASGADGDDLNIVASSTSPLFNVSVVDGVARIQVRTAGTDPLTADGQSITIASGLTQATLEFDIDGRFNEDNFAIAPQNNPTSVIDIRDAIINAIQDSSLETASVSLDPNDPLTILVSADDEDGVDFASDINPQGFLNAGIPLPIDVTVTGGGILQAWIDFNADGDFDEANEQIIPMPTEDNAVALRNEICPADTSEMASNVFSGDGTTTRTFCIVVPPSASLPETLTSTYARFRVSREGDLGPSGLALSGEVEDYELQIQPGSPPEVDDMDANRVFVVSEDVALQALDADGNLTPTQAGDNGLLVDVVDRDGQNVEVFAGDVGSRQLQTVSGTAAGLLNVFADGTFTFVPQPNFFGEAVFTVRVNDINPASPENVLISPREITVTLDVQAVNDPPVATTSGPIAATISGLEDQVQVFGADAFVDPFFSPGPANESEQLLIFQSVEGVGINQSALGGVLAISADGRSVTYTPPADQNNVVDTFEYIVADVPAAGQIARSATRRGTISISLDPVNDAPRTGDDLFFNDDGVLEGQSKTIPIADLLSNDTAGPADELVPDANGNRQAIRLIETDFGDSSVTGLVTFQGGRVFRSGENLIYEPPAFFSGVDSFEYRVFDVLEDPSGNIINGTSELGLISNGLVRIGVGPVNSPPQFLRVENPNAPPNQRIPLPIVRDESSIPNETLQFDLDTFFRDPEDDPMTYQVSVDDTSIVAASLNGSILTLTYVANRPTTVGDPVILNVIATDDPGAGETALSTSVNIPIIVNDVQFPPERANPIGTLSGAEDTLITADLNTVFIDRDGTDLTFTITRFDGIGGTGGQVDDAIQASDLVQDIAIVNGELQITLVDDANGTVNIEVTASDGTSQISDAFTLNVTPVPDAPTAVDDTRNVPLGTETQILDTRQGLLGNDFDVDGDDFNLVSTSVGSFTGQFGTLTIEPDGRFTYLNTSGTIGDTESFDYTIEDATGLRSSAQITFMFNESLYQNPVLTQDVNADGRITPIDALRILNLLRRESTNAFPVSEFDNPPPDFYDVSGNGIVSPLDALQVINEIRRRGGAAEGEFVGGIDLISALASTTSYAGLGSSGLPTRNLATLPKTLSPVQIGDSLLAAGLDIQSNSSASLEFTLDPLTRRGSGETESDSLDSIFAALDDQNYWGLDSL